MSLETLMKGGILFFFNTDEGYHRTFSLPVSGSACKTAPKTGLEWKWLGGSALRTEKCTNQTGSEDVEGDVSLEL